MGTVLLSPPPDFLPCEPCAHAAVAVQSTHQCPSQEHGFANRRSLSISAQEINCASPRPHVSLIVFQPSFKIVKRVIGNPGTIVFQDCPSGIFLSGSFACSPIELFFYRIGPAPRWSTEGIAITYLVVSLWQRQGHQLILLKGKRLKYHANVRKDSNTITTLQTSYIILITSLLLYPIIALFNLKPHCRPRYRLTSLSIDLTIAPLLLY